MRLDAERATFELQQVQGVEQARAAFAAIEDPELRKRHQKTSEFRAVLRGHETP